jgi:hypothetical protein
LKYNYFKLAVIFLLGALLVVYTNCGQPFSAPSELVFESNVYGGGSEASYKAFEKTVYPITRSYCISCHTTQEPMHAADDVRVAHDAVIKGFKVNFSNIPSSRMVLKLRDLNHNCWSDCAENADEMEAAISEWNDAIKASGVVSAPVDTAVYTDESDTLENEFMDSSNPLKSNTIKLNIEAAMLKAPMAIFKPVGAESYLSVPNGTTPVSLIATDANAGTANFSFKVPATGQYRVFALAHAPTADDNRVFVNVKSGVTSVVGGVKTWDIPVGTKFDWYQVPNINNNLTKDTMYTLELRQGEDGAKISAFIVTADTSFNGMEVGDFFGITLSYDLSPALKQPATLLIDVIEYDAYSYKFSKPRIVSASNIYAKGVKLLVNGSFSPQHSTYTMIDKIITPMDNTISPYSMIVIKDKGMAGDHIKFSFDQLAVTTGSATGTAAGGATGGTAGQTSLEAFQQTVYPISRSSAYSCVGCHMSVSPRHASDNTLTAHDAALTVVDFNNPANSRIVNKMKVERHNCGANCDNIGTLYQNAIQEWKNRRQ